MLYIEKRKDQCFSYLVPHAIFSKVGFENYYFLEIIVYVKMGSKVKEVQEIEVLFCFVEI